MQQVLNFKGWMAANHVKILDIAKLLGVSYQSAYLKVNGKGNFTLSQISLICQKYGISADIFLPQELRYGNNGDDDEMDN